ncbi:PREDICTED: purine nucleoside phosphorylase 1 [Drosophila arizonae]|uniref:purine-nucleoside phosphorylase n=1 Tax=Drosophila arizonae TaxID=7263 RepID=A0ABM1PFJ3_DROAR|nr:PREDICTED: purine nucleoside phosphorylase 1 [Drosophila arizonae]
MNRNIKMCNRDCCALKTALTIRRMKLLIEKRLQEEANAKPKDIIETPQAELYSFDDVQKMANFIINRTEKKPKFGLILSSHVNMLADLVESPVVIQYTDIPKFPVSPLHGNNSKLFVGQIMGGTVIAIQGRMHVYEGNPVGSCTLPVRMFKLCGVEYLILICSAGAISAEHNVGDVVAIKDHINVLGWCGNSPLIGLNDARFGQRRPSMIDAYDEMLLDKATEISREIGQDSRIKTGVYVCMGGPSYETAAEQRFLRKIGADVIGISMVPEVIIARHCGLKVLGLTLVTLPPNDVAVPAQNEYSTLLMQGKKACIELVSRIIYKIQNNL